MLRQLCWLLVLSVQVSLAGQNAPADEIPVRVVTQCCQFKAPGHEGPDAASIDRYLFDQTRGLEIEVNYVNLTRALKAVRRFDNVCTPRVRKTPEREKSMHFSQLPYSIYPPNRLITLAGSGHFDGQSQVDLQSRLPARDVKVGVFKLFTYGRPIEKARARYPESFLEMPTVGRSDHILLKLLEAGRVDAIISDARTVEESLETLGQEGASELKVADLAFLSIDGVEANVGHLACSKTPQGRRILDAIDQTLARPDIQQTLLKVHLDWFPPSEKAFLNNMFEKIYGISKKD